MVGRSQLVMCMCLLVAGALHAGTMTAKVVEQNKGFCASGTDTFCVFNYTLEMEFEGETGNFEYLDKKLRVKPPLHEAVMEANKGQLPKIFCMLFPQEKSMEVVHWENNDPENNNPPEPRFPKGVGGMGIANSCVVGWIVGDNVYLTYGFVGNGIYGFFATWDCDDEIREVQKQPGGCVPWTGGDEEYYIVPLAQMKSGKTFTITRDFDSTDGDMWQSHSTYTITVNP